MFLNREALGRVVDCLPAGWRPRASGDNVRRFLVAVTLAVIAQGLVPASAGAAAAKSTSLPAWTSQFCTALQAWGKQSDAIGNQIESDAVQAGGNLAAAKAVIVKDIRQGASMTGQTAQMIQQAGTPSVPKGKKLSALYVNGFKTSQHDLLEVATAANSLPTDNPSNFLSGVSTRVIPKLQVDPITPAFKAASKLDQGNKLANALQANPKCKFLSSG